MKKKDFKNGAHSRQVDMKIPWDNQVEASM